MVLAGPSPGKGTSFVVRPLLSVLLVPTRLLKAAFASPGVWNTSTARRLSMPPPSKPMGWGGCRREKCSVLVEGAEDKVCFVSKAAEDLVLRVSRRCVSVCVCACVCVCV
jgi:hypothetical protein